MFSDINAISSAVELTRLQSGRYPTTDEGFQSVVDAGFLKRRPRDPWGTPYQYRSPGIRNPESYDVWSYGSDGLEGGEGLAADYGNWEQPEYLNNIYRERVEAVEGGNRILKYMGGAIGAMLFGVLYYLGGFVRRYVRSRAIWLSLRRDRWWDLWLFSVAGALLAQLVVPQIAV